MCRCHLAPVLMLSVGALALPVRRPYGFSPSQPLTASHRLAVGFPGRSVGLSPRVLWVLAGLTWSPCDLTPCPRGRLAFRHHYNITTPAECQHLFHDFLKKVFGGQNRPLRTSCTHRSVQLFQNSPMRASEFFSSVRPVERFFLSALEWQILKKLYVQLAEVRHTLAR